LNITIRFFLDLAAFDLYRTDQLDPRACYPKKEALFPTDAEVLSEIRLVELPKPPDML
jgi:hypothetical protein